MKKITTNDGSDNGGAREWLHLAEGPSEKGRGADTKGEKESEA